MKSLVKPVILCGGAGTRLWPLSRQDLPKQFIDFSDSKFESKSLFRYAINRISQDVMQQFADAVILNPLIVASKEHRFIIREQLKGSRYSPDIFFESCSRNTAASLTMAALLNEQEDPILVVLPSDQAIDRVALNASVSRALPSCEQGHIVLLGVKPTYPETGFGYIKTSTVSEEIPVDVEAFVEKPNLEVAKTYLNEGTYLWNSGIFILKASTWMKALKVCSPDIEDACRKAYGVRTKMYGGEITIDREHFSRIRKDSIDYAVIERCTRFGISVKVLSFTKMWNDLGSWKSVFDVVPRDERNNFHKGQVIQQGCEQTLMVSTSRLVVGNSLKNIAILEMPDAVLVTALDESQNIKGLVEEMSRQQREEVVHHRKTCRPWGYFDSIDEAPGFKVKRIVVNPGASLSLQSHKHRAEHWTVVSGVALVRIDDKEQTLVADQSIYIPKGSIHRLSNPGMSDLIVVEVQTGGYLGEDDIVRYDDLYDR